MIDDILSQTSINASDARDNLYNLIKSAAKGLRSYEINLRGHKPVVLISKEELDGWRETLDIMSNPEEVEAIAVSRKETRTISHQQMLKEIGLSDEAGISSQRHKTTK
jgi:prevent-host-death family protein